MMTFENVRTGLAADCKCMEQQGLIEDTTGTYARRVQKTMVSGDDFLSYQEERGDFKGSTKCEDICKWYGVSINLITEDNEPELFEEWKAMVSHKRKLKSQVFCKFRLRQDAGLIQPTARVNGSPSQKSHCTLFKCDSFSLSAVEVLRIVPLV